MSRDHLDPVELAELAAEDQALSNLLDEYVRRRELAMAPCVLDLMAAAAEFGDRAAANLRAVIALYERLRDIERRAA